VTRRRLPIGLQTFRKIREDHCYYVDKTPYIRDLLDTGTRYFLSRPQCFGNNLFLDTLKELFEGNEQLFEGLDIHAHRGWSVRHLVLRLSFGSGNFKEPGTLHASLLAQLDAVFAALGLDVVVEFAPPGAAMVQLKRRRYADEYRNLGEPIHLVAVEFSKDTRNLTAFEVERA